MKELLGFELYSQLYSPVCSAQEESAVSVAVNQPGSQQLPLTLLGVLLCSIKKCSMKHQVPFLLLEMFLQCLTHLQKLNSLGAPPCSQRAWPEAALAHSKPHPCLFNFSIIRVRTNPELSPSCFTSPAVPLESLPWSHVGSRGFLLEETKVSVDNLHLTGVRYE